MRHHKFPQSMHQKAESSGSVGRQYAWWETTEIGNLNTLRPRQNGHHFSDDIFKWIFVNENAWIWIEISLKFVLRGPINNIPALFHIMVGCRPSDKPLSEPMMAYVDCNYFLTNCYPVTSYEVRYRHHCLRQWLVDQRHQTIPWNNVDLSPIKSVIFIWATTWEIFHIFVISFCLEITYNITATLHIRW